MKETQKMESRRQEEYGVGAEEDSLKNDKLLMRCARCRLRAHRIGGALRTGNSQGLRKDRTEEILQG